MILRRLAYISIVAMIIISLGLALNFDGFKVLTLLSFILAADLQIIAAIRYEKMRAIIERMKNEESE